MGSGHAGCTGISAFSSVQLTTLGNSGPTGPTGVNGYVTLPCPDVAGQLVQSGAIAIATDVSGVQRFTVPVTGNYTLNATGEWTMLGSKCYWHLLYLEADEISPAQLAIVVPDQAGPL